MSKRLLAALEAFARAGYAARGFVYLSLGLFALGAALEWVPRPDGTAESLERLADWPLGQVWLGAIAFGLAGFAAWRLLQSVFDADRQGTKAKALASRAGQAISGLVYGALAVSAFELLDVIEDVRETAPGGGAESGAAEVLSLPFGGAVLVIVGLFVGGVGVAGPVRAVTGDFCRRLSCRAGVRTAAKWLGRIGYAGRGVAFLPSGFFLIEAGLDQDAAQARSLGESLQVLERQPFGSFVLAAVALGLLAFGAYALLEARFRHIDVPDPT
jgi:hypothetical protein